MNLGTVWTSMEGLPGTITLLDSKQVDCNRYEARSVVFPPELVLRANVATLMAGEIDLIRPSSVYYFIRCVCDVSGEDHIFFVDTEDYAKRAIEKAYQRALQARSAVKQDLKLLVFM